MRKHFFDGNIVHKTGDTMTGDLYITKTGISFIRVTDNNAANDYACLQAKTGASANIWQWFAHAGKFICGISGVGDYVTISGGNFGIGTDTPTSKLHVVGILTYANNAAAIAGGLTAGALYKNGADPDMICIVH